MRVKYTILGLVMGLFLSSLTVVLAGSLDSPDVPRSTESYTLEDIWSRLDSGAAGTKSTFTEPEAGPDTATMHTLDEIMAKAPATHTNAAMPTQILSGTVAWGLSEAAWGMTSGTLEYAAPVPDTGQTITKAVGDDADWRAIVGVDWPSPRFTDNGDGTVTDRLTNLIWLKDAGCWEEKKNWKNAVGVCNALASGSCGLSDGSSAGDWRLPNRYELESLLDMSKKNPALPRGKPFTGVADDKYWTSTTSALDDSYAWYVDVASGSVDYDPKTGNFHYVWPVRGGQ